MKDLRLAIPPTTVADDNNNTDYSMTEEASSTSGWNTAQDECANSWGCGLTEDSDAILKNMQCDVNSNTGWKSAPIILYESKY